MKFWLDAQFSPAIADWLNSEFPEHQTIPLRDLGLRDADDTMIFLKARTEKVVVITKDSDFVTLVEYFGIPPQVIWVRCGNTSNASLKNIFARKLDKVLLLLSGGASIVELRDK
jgi:predicted nuclease of predicted toxin-antitoxin system